MLLIVATYVVIHTNVTYRTVSLRYLLETFCNSYYRYSRSSVTAIINRVNDLSSPSPSVYLHKYHVSYILRLATNLASTYTSIATSLL